jgi:hypothetical protein
VVGAIFSVVGGENVEISLIGTGKPSNEASSALSSEGIDCSTSVVLQDAQHHTSSQNITQERKQTFVTYNRHGVIYSFSLSRYY